MSLKRPSPGARPPMFLQEGVVLPAELQQALSPGEWDGGTGLRVNTLTQGVRIPSPGSGSLYTTQPAPCPGWDPSLHLPGRASGVPGPLAAFGGRPFSAVLTASEPQGGECGHEDCSDWCGHPWPGSAPQGGGARMGAGAPRLEGGGARMGVPKGRNIISFKSLVIISPSYKRGNRPREGQLFTQDLPPTPGLQWEVCDSDPSLQPQAEDQLN